jgi:hypothetical protein
LARRVQEMPNREIRTQIWQALNNAPLRLADYKGWMNRVLDVARPGNTAQVVGFVGDEVADFMRLQQPAEAPVRVVAIAEKHLVHADSAKHQAAGIALSREQYMALPGIIAKPDAVYFDTEHNRFAYVRQLADGGVIFASLETDQALKQVGRLDALVNAYRLPGTPEGAGRLQNVVRFVKMGGR